ncbi:MAG: carbamoyl-phosphate synthase large subunit [Phycisphaeraceae bacterium]|nr:MAG: carbamoyl-phosphate synthase large subunit [Phycisphaeraceae bacterium]
MPKRTDIRTILVIGSGPIVIGQGCEFDYSGAQACKTLRAEGYRIVLVNSNPATIMTDPSLSDRTYIEPITPEAVRKVIQREFEQSEGKSAASQDSPVGKIDVILPTLGGQTALNCACKLFDDGTLAEFGVEMIGADRKIIHRAEDRQQFKDICEGIGLSLPKAKTVTTMEDALAFLDEIGLPAIIRPAFTLGGSGGGIAYNRDEFRDIVARGLAASMITQVQIDQSIIGWKEYELEVVRDKKDNCIIVCGIENIDAMGVHTGDSVTVAPILTLTDKEYQAMRDAAIAIMRAVGVETGGSNVQFAVNPNPPLNENGKPKFQMMVVEMNPRVSRSSALASKATGFPIAKIAAKLAVGYTLDELRNDITGTTSACFEPAIDYVVTKMPRWTFEKFPEADETLTTQMKSVGEAMAIGRTFKESFQKVVRSMDVKRFGLGLDKNDKWLTAMRAVEHDQLVLDLTPRMGGSTGLRTADGAPIEWPIPLDKLHRKLAVPSQGRLYYVRYAFKMGWTIPQVHELTKIDPFFLDQFKQMVEFEDVLCGYRTLEELPREVLLLAKQWGYSDAQLANLYFGNISSENILKVRAHRKSLGIEPTYRLVDTCAAEFEAITPYYYSTYENEYEVIGADGKGVVQRDDEIRVTDKKKVVILGGGPNRIGQGIEFDYCCVHAAYAARDLGFESVMINSNPETVSTDYDTSDLLFFEPLTLEDVLNIVERLDGSTAASATRVVDLLTDAEMAAVGAMPHQPFGKGGASEIPGLTDLSLPSDLSDQLDRVRSAQNVSHLAIISAGRTWLPDLEANVISVGVLTSDGTVGHAYFSPDGQLLKTDWLSHWTEWYDEETETEDRARAQQWLASLPSSVTPSLVHGLIVQFGGQTPLNLAKGLALAGAPLIGTTLDSIDLAEDRKRFDALLEKLKLERPAAGIARSLDEAVTVASSLGYPVLVRPSYVLGGRGMEICPDEKALRHFITNALRSSDLEDAPVLIDRFLDAATEVDVDVVADFGSGGSGGTALVCGVMEHIEQAGIHSGDSACTLPPWSLPRHIVERIRQISRDLARELKVCGLMNVQLAVKDEHIYIIEVNPRASRTVPFVAKAKHVPWPRIAAMAMMGRSLAEMGVKEVPDTGAYAVKMPVFPFNRFPGVDVVLGPEMRSTGEVMGMDVSLPLAFLKALLGAGTTLPKSGGVFISVREQDRKEIVGPARTLMAMGYTVYATKGTGDFLRRHGLRPVVLEKIGAAIRPNVLDLMSDGKIQLVLNTPTRTGWQTDEGRIRSTAVRLGIPMITTNTGANAAVRAIEALRAGDWDTVAMQEYKALAASAGASIEPVVVSKPGTMASAAR